MSHLSRPPLQSALLQPAKQAQPPGGLIDDVALISKYSVSDARIKKTIEFLESNLHCNLSLETIARNVNLSPSYLRALFCEVTGCPLAEYVKQMRMEAARHLLATEFLTIKEVLAQTGIKDPSHFNRDFKLKYGVTPAQYRNRNT